MTTFTQTTEYTVSCPACDGKVDKTYTEWADVVRGGQGPLRPVVVETKPAVAKPEQDDSPKVTPTPTPRKGKVKATAPHYRTIRRGRTRKTHPMRGTREMKLRNKGM